MCGGGGGGIGEMRGTVAQRGLRVSHDRAWLVWEGRDW